MADFFGKKKNNRGLGKVPNIPNDIRAHRGCRGETHWHDCYDTSDESCDAQFHDDYGSWPNYDCADWSSCASCSTGISGCLLKGCAPGSHCSCRSYLGYGDEYGGYTCECTQQPVE